ncbi:YezD family protein [Alkalimonas amylolytica]|uniref:DUF2292 domain-containing protein n=1 Tax=Alkalimonas amylolytica TaxID=152573 RepID=A0A1H4CKF7_ALKAM|nr:YezD family protein [Alkalimonas amylolytica]SEA60542.1 hypothetical protein SAMN04488051_104192 [Alkalimonas amylolytica]
MTNTQHTAEQLTELANRIEQLVGRIEYGSIELVFHHGKLVQLEKIEKIRLDKPAP